MQRSVASKANLLGVFQSMHPIKDATAIQNISVPATVISIHAPYKGCNDVISD